MDRQMFPPAPIAAYGEHGGIRQIFAGIVSNPVGRYGNLSIEKVEPAFFGLVAN